MCTILFLFLIVIGRKLFGEDPFPHWIEIPVFLMAILLDVLIGCSMFTYIRHG